jgi:hypothetical protein
VEGGGDRRGRDLRGGMRELHDRAVAAGADDGAVDPGSGSLLLRPRARDAASATASATAAATAAATTAATTAAATPTASTGWQGRPRAGGSPADRVAHRRIILRPGGHCAVAKQTTRPPGFKRVEGGGGARGGQLRPASGSRATPGGARAGRRSHRGWGAGAWTLFRLGDLRTVKLTR